MARLKGEKRGSQGRIWRGAGWGSPSALLVESWAMGVQGAKAGA